MKLYGRKWPLIAALMWVAGCAKPGDDWLSSVDRFENEVGTRIGAVKGWSSDNESTRLAAEKLLAEPLTAESAATIALLRNRSVRAALAEVGVKQADLLEAGLLKDPVVAASVRFPNRPPSGANTEFSLTQPLMEALLMPLRKEVARGERESAVLRAAKEAVDIATEAMEATHALRASQAAVAQWKVELVAAEAAAELADAQRESGAASEMAADHRRAELIEAKLDAARADLSAAAARERLVRLLGVEGPQASTINVADAPATIPPVSLEPADAERLAIERRLDVTLARREIAMIDRAIELTKAGVWTGVHIGVDTERESDGARLTGPSIEWEVPLFNRRKGEIARLEAQRRAAVERTAAVELNAKSEAREALAAWRSAVSVVKSTGELSSLREQIVVHALERYNRMTLGTFELLATRRDEASARRREAEAAAEHHIARVKLERAIGGTLPTRLSSASTQPATQPAPAPTTAPTQADPHAHHHHH